MVRPAQWIQSITMGLLLSVKGLPSQAQQFTFPGEPTPARLSPADDTDESNDESSDRRAEYGPVADEDGAVDRGTTTSDTSEDDVRDSDAQPSTELIKERFPDGSVKIEREVTQDAQGNYVNHGSWKMLDQRGNIVAEGEYRHGERTGTWIRWYRSVVEANMLSKLPYQQFVGPFISQATFKNGQLDGHWTIFDGKQHKISHWKFTDGRRDGTSTWWYANGHKMREIEFREGDMDGQFIEWGPEGSVLIKDSYQGGRKLAQKVAKFPAGGKKSAGMYLFARDVEQTPDDWWNCKIHTATKTGKDEKHGAWTSWHSNGQKQLEGTYEHDVQVGPFTWWHSNGQKALEGRFESGKQDGVWTWWYASGQKSIHGEYARGNPTGRWTWWKEDGKVAQSADLSHSEGVVVETLPSMDPNTMPQAAKPKKMPAAKR